MWGGEGVRVEAVVWRISLWMGLRCWACVKQRGRREYVLEDIAGGAVFGVDERFGLGVAVG